MNSVVADSTIAGTPRGVLQSFRLDGRTALITGASSGIGAALAEGFAAAGAHVVLAARRLERIEALAARLSDVGAGATALAMDVTRSEHIQRVFDDVQRAGRRVQIVVNNAGVAEPRTILKTPRDTLERTLQTNFVAAWDIARTAAHRMIEAGLPGSIINVASVLAAGSAVGYGAYSASKAALVQLTSTLGLELVRHRIRVNALAPGWFISEMNEAFFSSPDGVAYRKRLPSGRTGELHELVGPALLLASDAGAFVNATVLPVDGGHHAALV
jgi:NAD(P)-dependent dehydrogenase (short-subunit alcohol dehydrogenase family)